MTRTDEPSLAASLLRPDADPLELFLGWVESRGLALYPAQEEAILAWMEGQHVVLNTPTGSGKSLVAVAAHARALASGRRSVYTSPIRALVSEKFFDLCRTFGAERVGMMIGQTSINPKAPILCCTAEVLANMALRQGEDTPADDVIMDEFHYYGDRDRGAAWQVPLLILRRARFLLMSATLGDISDIRAHIETFTSAPVAVVRGAQRPVPLQFAYKEIPLHETLEALLKENKAPVYVVHFSQNEASQQAQHFTSLSTATREVRERIRDEVGRFRFDTPFGKTMQRLIHHGIGVHHAGLLPRYRLLVERLAQQGLLSIIAGTDTLGVGVNVPIRSVLFTKLCKFDGKRVSILSVRDFHQIAGRAGRKGYDDRGWVVVQAPEHVIENKRLEAKVAAGKVSKKKVVKAQPPQRGFMPWNEATFQQLVDGQPEALSSRFRVDHALVLHLLQRSTSDDDPGGYRELVRLIGRCHDGEREKRIHRRTARTVFQALHRAGIAEVERREGAPGKRAFVSPALQPSFALDQALSLFFLHGIESLEALGWEPIEYARGVLSLAEAIEPNPMNLLRRQLDRIKTDAVRAMKQEGLDYEERMARLEEITWPKPHAELFYTWFNAYQERHPWLSQDNIRPKGIALHIVDTFASFNDVVRQDGLERIEGALLRYLGQVYRTLSRTVPPAYLNDPLVDIIAFLRALLERTDSSLLQQWESLVEGEEGTEDTAPAPPPVQDISQDTRSFFARIRAEVHLFLRALSHEDYEEALGYVRPGADDSWTPERLQEALAPYLATYGHVACDHRARGSAMTRIIQREHHVWSVEQTLLDPAEDLFWRVEAEVDLRGDTAPQGPLCRLVDITDR